MHLCQYIHLIVLRARIGADGAFSHGPEERVFLYHPLKGDPGGETLFQFPVYFPEVPVKPFEKVLSEFTIISWHNMPNT
jgi:hypothetical protein